VATRDELLTEEVYARLNAEVAKAANATNSAEATITSKAVTGSVARPASGSVAHLASAAGEAATDNSSNLSVLTITETETVTNGLIQVRYDAEKVTFVSAETVARFNSIKVDETAGQIVIAYANKNGIAAGDTIATIVFEVGNNASEAEIHTIERNDELGLDEIVNALIPGTGVQDTYTITWQNWDGTVLAVDNVPSGQMPLYSAETPHKAASANVAYEFASWYPTPSEATQDAIYTAEFKGVSLTEATPTTDFRFTAASLSLFEDLSVNFKTKKAMFTDGYSNIHAIITICNEARVVDCTSYNATDYQFVFKNVYARYMNTTIYAVLYAEKDGVLYCTDTLEYSVAQYAYNKLAQNTGSDMPWLAPLVVDMLNYGSAVQRKFGYRADDPCNARLTAEQQLLGTQDFDVNDLVSVQAIVNEVDSPSATWKSGGLRLAVSVDLRLGFELVNTEGTYILLTDTDRGETWRADASAYVVDTAPGHTNQYYVYFRTLKLSEMSDALEARIYNANGDQISDVLHYSIESYVKSKILKNEDPDEVAVLTEMIKFGHSAYAYKHRNDP
jgi:hypothetical protein